MDPEFHAFVADNAKSRGHAVVRADHL
jgi:hypothetical protein